MILWRLTDPRFARDLSGAGNRLFGGRWNSPGRGIVYCAEHLSLAVLENFVHLPAALRADMPPRMVVRIEVPDTDLMLNVHVLPRGKRDEKLAIWCRDVGDRWLDDGKHLALRVPSVIVPPEFNVMLNATHAAMRDVRIVDAKVFVFDNRLSSRNSKGI